MDPVLLPRFFILSLFVLFIYILITLQPGKSSDKSNYMLIRRAVFIAYGGYLLFTLISLTKAINVSEGLVELLKVFVFIQLLYVSAMIFMSDTGSFERLVKAVTVSSIILGVMGILEYHFGLFYWIPGNFHPHVTMASRNHFGSFMFLSLPFVLYGALRLSAYWKTVCTLTVLLIAYCIMISTARAVWVAVVAALIVTIIFRAVTNRKVSSSSKKPRSLQKRTVFIAVMFLLVAISVLLFVDIQIRTRDTFRLTIWSKTLDMIRDNPLLGVGAGNWRIVFPSYGLTDMLPEMMTGELHYQRTHNDFIWVLAETGIFGLIFYMGVFGLILYYAGRIFRNSNHEEDRILSLVMIFGIVGYMTIAFFTYPRERIEHSVYLTLMMAVVLSRYHVIYPLQLSRRRLHPAFAAIVVIIILCLSFITGWSRLTAEIHTKRALMARQTQDWKTVIEEIDQAGSPVYTIDPTSAPPSWFRGVAYFSLGDYDAALTDFQRAYKYHPYHIHVLNNLASCYEVTGDHDRSIEYYRKALLISPGFEEALLNLSVVYYNKKQYIKAYETISRCDPNSKNPKVAAYREEIMKQLDMGQ